MPAFDAAILTVARNSVWNAITNGEGTGVSVFRQFRGDGDPNKVENQIPTGIRDLPAIRVEPSKIDNQWVTQRYQDFDYFLDVLVYETTLANAEGSWEQIWKAVIRTCPVDSTVPYTRSAQGKPAALLGSTFEKKKIGKNDKFTVWIVRMTFGLRTQAPPHGA